MTNDNDKDQTATTKHTTNNEAINLATMNIKGDDNKYNYNERRRFRF
jgi:hypothetical protein